jgi:hypothetical protein
LCIGFESWAQHGLFSQPAAQAFEKADHFIPAAPVVSTEDLFLLELQRGHSLDAHRYGYHLGEKAQAFDFQLYEFHDIALRRAGAQQFDRQVQPLAVGEFQRAEQALHTEEGVPTQSVGTRGTT